MIQEISTMVTKGVVSDVFRAEQAHAVMTSISPFAGRLNSSKKGYGEAFGYVQRRSQEEIILAVSRIFDKPHSKYPTYCFSGLLQFIEKNLENLPKIHNKYELSLAMGNAGFSKEAISALELDDDVQLNHNILHGFHEMLEDLETQRTLDLVRLYRDKRIAHNEAVERIESAQWGQILDLIEVAKKLIGVIGWAYINHGYFVNGEYLLTADAKRLATSFKNLCEEAT